MTPSVDFDLDDRDARLVYADQIGGERGELIVLAHHIATGGATNAQKARERLLRRKFQMPYVGSCFRLTWRNGFIDRVECPMVPEPEYRELGFIRELELRGDVGPSAITPDLVTQLSHLRLRYLGFGSDKFVLEVQHIAMLRAAIPTLRGFGVTTRSPREVFDMLVAAGFRDIDIGPIPDHETALAIAGAAPADMTRLVLHGGAAFTTSAIVDLVAERLPKLRHFGISGVPAAPLLDRVVEIGFVDRLASLAITVERNASAEIKKHARRIEKLELLAAPTEWSEDAWKAQQIALRELYFDLGEPERQLDILDRIMTLAPTEDLAVTNLGPILYDLQRYEEEIEVCDEILARDPKNIRAQNSRGDALMGLERWDEALAYWKKLHAKRRTRIYKHVIATTLRYLDRHADSLVWIERLLEEDADDTLALLKHAECLESLGRLADATVAYQRLIDHPQSSDGDKARALGHFGRHAMTRGDHAAVLEHLAKAIPLAGNRDRMWVVGMYADTLALTGDYERSLATYREHLDSDHDNMADLARSSAGYALLALGRPAEALPLFRARTVEPDGLGQALALLALGDHDAALAAIDATEPGDPCPFVTACSALVRAAIARSRGDAGEERAQLRTFLGPKEPVMVIAERDPYLRRIHQCISISHDSCNNRAAAAVAVCAELAGSAIDATNRIADLANVLEDNTSRRLNPIRTAIRAWPTSPKIEALLAVVEGYGSVSVLAPFTVTPAHRRRAVKRR